MDDTPVTARRGRPAGTKNKTPRAGSETERIVQFLDANPGLTLDQVCDRGNFKRGRVRPAVTRWRPRYFTDPEGDVTR